MERKVYIEAFKKLKKWALKEGFKHIATGHDNISYISWENGTLNEPLRIRIQSGFDSEHRVYLLLHELGHHQLRKDWDWFAENFPVLAKAEVHHIKNKGNYLKRRKDYQMYSMEEEFRAWNEGLNLAYGMNIPVDMIKWNALRTKCLIQYFNFYCGK